MVKTDYNGSGNHRVKLSFGRPKQVWPRVQVVYGRFFYVRSVTLNLNAAASRYKL